MIDKNYCMSHYLAFRFIKNENINFFNEKKHQAFTPMPNDKLVSCRQTEDIEAIINKTLKNFLIPRKTAIFLSGGIDSAILASYLPAGTKAYTFKCIADNAIDETNQAKLYADKYNLDHEIIEIHWDDFEKYTEQICMHQNTPVHSIEIQLYKASIIAKSSGIERVIVGDGADYIFGGMDKLLSKDWSFDEWVTRYTFVDPIKVLKEPVSILDIYENYRLDGNKIDFIRFMNDITTIESFTSYHHAFSMANIEYIDPYSFMVMSEPLDLQRIRNGEPKYMLRELFKKRYPELIVPNKIPMPRAMDQWLSNWKGPIRDEFLSYCIENMTGDQKWLVWCLEKFLNLYSY